MPVKFTKLYTLGFVDMRKNEIFVFGDNIKGYGTAGQAIIRNRKNAFGLPTKFAPSMDENAFFEDTEACFNIVKKKLSELADMLDKDVIVNFPVDGLGTGLAKLPEKAPKLYKYICDVIEMFKIKYGVIND